ncbi:hypothetical protein G3I60_13925 [Streptomyces sp. SID13666]|uniref:hypothetical protein n=1 Tax=unclassified Streptomyces TaxID=2593676 RepID=UPI0013BEC163|nr:MULTISPECIES: hypothetical protein [unclassified Streptomyces]NEA55217.1 hypothetical protein [Streptomyces sp. SID13666]NEA76425.1 hypothetical protein [Streptomyces sp. SID13588]
MTSVSAPHRISETAHSMEATPNTLSEDEVARLAEFLESAEALIISPGSVADPFAENEDMRVRVGIMTDGEWTWDLAWADYVLYHKVAPPQEFMNHARDMNFLAPEIPVDRLMEISESLGIPLP